MGVLQRLWWRFEPSVRWVREFLEDRWFDRTRHIATSGNVTLSAAGLRHELHGDSEFYQPARPRHIRQALRESGANDLSEFTFVDLGSGKGRTLFVAADFPFLQVIGVEFTSVLHQQAARNVQSFRNSRAACRRIVAIHANAKDFVFPKTPLFLYLFNPFGRDTMRVVLDNLLASLQQRPRQLIVVLLWPRCEDMIASIPGMRLTRTAKEYQIFQLDPQA